MVRLPVADSNCSATVAFLYDGHTRHILHDSKEGGLCSANRKKQTISIAIHRAITTTRSSLQLFVLAVVSAIHNGICLEDSPTFTIDSMHKCFQKKKIKIKKKKQHFIFFILFYFFASIALLDTFACKSKRSILCKNA
jgi:hypothetical protein